MQSSVVADELRDYILDAASDVQVDQKRGDPDAQDFGATLALLLATSAVTAVAKGIKRWLEQRDTAKVTFKNGRKTLVVENISATSAAELAEQVRALLGTDADE